MAAQQGHAVAPAPVSAAELAPVARQTHARGFDKDRVIMKLRLGDQIAVDPEAAGESG